jgi:hypothetical protein
MNTAGVATASVKYPWSNESYISSLHIWLIEQASSITFLISFPSPEAAVYPCRLALTSPQGHHLKIAGWQFRFKTMPFPHIYATHFTLAFFTYTRMGKSICVVLRSNKMHTKAMNVYMHTSKTDPQS